jgi:hypothetical protein
VRETIEPSGLNTDEARLLIEKVRGEDSLAARIGALSSHFLGRRYIADSLVGGPREPETFSATLEGFDCVTYIETVLALALSDSPDEFADALRRIRYEGGVIEYGKRNHYMTGWVASNEREGMISNITAGAGTKKKTRQLNVVEGIPARDVSFRCYPKNSFSRARSLINTGDIILFASTKKELDVFHAGILIVDGDEILIRHATRSVGRVIQEPLERFLKNNGMSGFILLRPLCGQ